MTTPPSERSTMSKAQGFLHEHSAFACTVLTIAAAATYLWGRGRSTTTLDLVAAGVALGLVAVLFATDRIRWWIAVPATFAIILALMTVQSAQANTRVHWKMYDGQCYRYSVTEYRDGLTFGLDGWLWGQNQRLDWCQTVPGAKVWYGPVVHRSYKTPSAWWKFGGYQVKTRVVQLDNPRRWRVYVKSEFYALPNLWGITEHNYPWVRMTIWKANPTHVHYTASCGCGS